MPCIVIKWISYIYGMKKLFFLFFVVASYLCNAQYTVLLDFNRTNGDKPLGSLTRVGKKLYGMTFYGNNIFSIDTNGSGYNDFLNFNGTDGARPTGSLLLSGGVFYGMTSAGGTIGDGVIFRLDTTNIGNSTNELKATSEAIKVFPNPNQGSFTLSLSNPDSYRDEKCSVEIYNVMGQMVLTETLRSTQGDNRINLTGQPGGVYFYRVLKEDGGLLGEGKVVVEK